MKTVIASDHGGFEYKQILISFLEKNGYEIHDLGSYEKNDKDDYPDFAAAVANAINARDAEKGILICGSGAGVSVAANKFKNIRAALCHDTYTAHQCVEHDDVNVLCIGQRVIGIELAQEIVVKFLFATFSNEERHKRRLQKVKAIEDENMK